MGSTTYLDWFGAVDDVVTRLDGVVGNVTGSLTRHVDGCRTMI